jgi:hypothetical protein
VSVRLPVDGLEGGAEGGAGGGVDGGVEGGGEGGEDDGGAVIAGVGGCNSPAIAGLLSRFNADREPLVGGAELLPADAVERTLAEPASGEGVIGATGAGLVEIIPARGVTADFVMGAGAVKGGRLLVSAVVCETCPDTMPCGSGPGSVWDEVGGAVIDATAGRLVKVR